MSVDDGEKFIKNNKQKMTNIRSPSESNLSLDKTTTTTTITTSNANNETVGEKISHMGNAVYESGANAVKAVHDYVVGPTEETENSLAASKVARGVETAASDARQDAARAARDTESTLSDEAHRMEIANRTAKERVLDRKLDNKLTNERQAIGESRETRAANHSVEAQDVKAAQVLRDATNKANDKQDHAANVARDANNKKNDKALKAELADNKPALAEAKLVATARDANNAAKDKAQKASQKARDVDAKDIDKAHAATVATRAVVEKENDKLTLANDAAAHDKAHVDNAKQRVVEHDIESREFESKKLLREANDIAADKTQLAANAARDLKNKDLDLANDAKMAHKRHK